GGVENVPADNGEGRPLSTKQKQEITAAAPKQAPALPNRRIAATVKVDHKTVGAVRTELEAGGEIPHQTTRTDRRGRAQPAAKPKPKKTEEAEVGLSLFPEPAANGEAEAPRETAPEPEADGESKNQPKKIRVNLWASNPEVLAQQLETVEDP